MTAQRQQASGKLDRLAVPATVAGGRYVLQEPLGSGGAASVYRARDESLALSRAVKVLRMGHEAIRERFLAEARVLARIRHPNVLRVVDYGEDEGTPWMAMELARGGTLADRLDKGPLPLARACEVLFEILAGLVVIHDSGFVHRDIKPSNVLFGAGDEAWVSDLGVVSGSEQVVKRHWQTSGPIGTIGYQSPEIRRDARDADHRADIYAVGATLWAMLTARPPIDFSVVSLKPEMLDVLPEAVRPILLRATAHSPSDRYPSCESMARDITTLHSQIKPTASPPDVAMMVFERLRRRSGMTRPTGDSDSLEVSSHAAHRPYSALTQDTQPGPGHYLRGLLLLLVGVLMGLGGAWCWCSSCRVGCRHAHPPCQSTHHRRNLPRHLGECIVAGVRGVVVVWARGGTQPGGAAGLDAGGGPHGQLCRGGGGRSGRSHHRRRHLGGAGGQPLHAPHHRSVRARPGQCGDPGLVCGLFGACRLARRHRLAGRRRHHAPGRHGSAERLSADASAVLRVRLRLPDADPCHPNPAATRGARIKRARAGRGEVKTHRLEVLVQLDQLGDMALHAVDNNDKAIAIAAVNGISDVLTTYLADKNQLPADWFHIDRTIQRDQDFVAMHPDIIEAIASRGTWVEMKALRQLESVFTDALNEARDVNHLIGIRMRDVVQAARLQQDAEALTLSLRFLNTYLRACINARDVRTAYNLFNELRLVAEQLMLDEDTARLVEMAERMKQYGQLAFHKDLPFILETAAYDLCSLLVRASRAEHSCHDALLTVFLDVDREPDSEQQEVSLRGVRKAQVKLATHYLATGDRARARRIQEDMRREPPERLLSIRRELLAITEPEYWEVSDRGINFDWIPPERRVHLDAFFAWFGQKAS